MTRNEGGCGLRTERIGGERGEERWKVGKRGWRGGGYKRGEEGDGWGRGEEGEESKE